MPQIRNYNLHDILKFQIIRERGRGIKDLINLKFSYFEVKDIKNPDIILNIGEFTPQHDNCFTVDHKYHVKENYFYCIDSEGSTKWEVEIINFEHGNTIINFNGKVNDSLFFPNPDFVAQNFLLRFVEYKLSEKGYLFAHSAGISKNGSAYIFAGRGGSFKTSFCMDFIRRRGFDFLGDDRVILHKDKAFSFPMALPVFNFMCENLPNEDSWNMLYKLKFAKWIYFKNKSQSMNSVRIRDMSKIKSITFIVKTNTDKITKRELSLEKPFTKFLINNRLEDFISLGGMGINFGPLLKYELAYSYIFPENKIVSKYNCLQNSIEEILKNIPLYEIQIPCNYSQGLFNEIQNLVEN